MPNFAGVPLPRLVSPVPLARPASAPPAATPAPTLQSTGEALTLDALMARQKNAAIRQQGNMQQEVSNIPQGLGQLGWTLVNALQERRAEKDLAAGQADVAKAFGQMDWTTGQLPPEAMQTLMQRDPETGIEMYKTAMALRAAQGKQENWTQIPTPQGETGQWYENTTTGEQKKVGGSTEGSGAKLSDIASLRQDYISDPSYKHWQDAEPIWASLQDAQTRDTPQSDLNIIIGMAKLFDPGSVVRTQEGEQVQQTAGLPTEIFSAWKYLSGQPGSRLDAYQPGMRKALLDEGYSRMKGYQSALQKHNEWITGIATRHGIVPNDVVDKVPVLGEWPPKEQADPNNPNPDTPAPVALPDASTPEGKAAYDALADGATYTIPGDDTIYVKQPKKKPPVQ